MDNNRDSPGQGMGIEGKINLQERRFGQAVATAVTSSYMQNPRH